MSAKNKVAKSLQSVLLARDTGAGGGSTTLAAAAAAGASSISATASTNFAVGDAVRVGAGELMEAAVIASIAGAGPFTIGLNDPLTYAHPSGDVLVEQTVFDLGDVTEGGVSVRFAGNTVQIPSGNRRLNFATLEGFVDMSAEFALPTFSLDNLAVSLGIPFADISGTGAFSTPHALVTDGNSFATEANQNLFAIGVLMDGTVARFELWGVDFDYSAVAAQLAIGVLAEVPMRAISAAGGVMTTNASTYVQNVTRRASKGDVFGSLDEVGLFANETAGTPVSTTTSGTNAAGQSVVNVASGTGVAAGQWYRIGAIGSDTVEFHRVASVSVNAVTLADRLLRAIPAATAFVQQKLVPFAGLADDGVRFGINGSVEPIRIGTSRLSVGMRPGDAAPQVSFSLIDVSLANFASALGIAASDIVGGRLPLKGSNVGKATMDGFYLRGLLKNGEQAWLNCWGCSQDIADVAAVFSSRQQTRIPFTLRPASGIQFMQHTP